MKSIFIMVVFQILSFNTYSQNNNDIQKLIFEFDYFKHSSTKFEIDYQTNTLTTFILGNKRNGKKEVVFKKAYPFLNKQIFQFNSLIIKNVPKKDIVKEESAFDGGGFKINFIKKNGIVLKINTLQPSRYKEKFKTEFKLIDSFFEFAYLIVKDTSGIKALDESYRPYLIGLPIRKVSESPLEYNIWGSISGSINGDVFMNKGFLTFLNNLPKDKCVIINCNDELSYSLQNDILSFYIIKNSNLHFLNNGYLKYTRKDLLKIKNEIKYAEDNNKEFNLTSENLYHYKMYMTDRIGFDNWLKKDEIMLNESIDDVKKKCK